MATHDQKPDTTDRELNSQALALAEQLGRIAGTLEGTAEAWLNRASVTDQLTKVRDGATQLLNSLAGGAADGRREVKAKPAESARTTRKNADPAHAPGKAHRKPPQSTRGAKHSDLTIPKAKASAAARRRQKSFA
jgi:hypothetical protein